MKLFSVFVFFFCLFFNITGHSSPFTEKLVTQYSEVIDHCTVNKIYLKPESIVSDGTTLYLSTNSKPVEIPFLHIDATGYYLLTNNKDQLIPWYKCTNTDCGMIWDVLSHYGNKCPQCGSPGQLQGM